MKAFLAVAFFGLTSAVLAPVAGITMAANMVALFILGGLACLGCFLFSDRSVESGFDWSEVEAEIKTSEAMDATFAETIAMIDAALDAALDFIEAVAVSVVSEAVETPAALVRDSASALVPVGVALWRTWTVKAAKNGRIFFSAETESGRKVNAPLPKTLLGAAQSEILKWSIKLKV